MSFHDIPGTALFQWLVSGAVLVVGVFLSYRYFARSRRLTPLKSADRDKRKETYIELKAMSARVVEFDTADLLLTTAIDLYNRKYQTFDSLDDKAQKLVALIGGGASLYVLFGGFSNNGPPRLTPLLIVAAISFFTSLILLLNSLAPSDTDIPSVSEFNSIPVLADPGMRARIAHRLIETWQDITFELSPILQRKAQYLYVASILLVAGATLLLINFLMVASQTRAADMHKINCVVQPLRQASAHVGCVESQL